jgi:RHS repeat-associated protein
LQDLYYVYDPVGNVTAIEDKAIRTVFNRNQRIDPIATYTYDAVYRLIKATGREHESMNYCYHQNRKEKNTEYFNLWQPITNGNALLNYTETYRYDESGNNVQIRKTNSVRTSTRNQTYESDSNRILTSSAGCAGESGYQYRHDANGNIVGMPHLNEMIWNYANQLVEVETTINNNGTNNRSYYQYSGSGQRVCKINESNGLQTDETLYLGALEIYRRYDNQGMLSFQRNTLHVSDGSKRIALVEIRKEDIDNIEQGLPVTRIRYQLDNHLGSSLIEVDDSPQNNIITIEEYYPFGGTSYLAGENEIEAKRKRYRYSGKERDDETGFYYYGARYYASWLARWCSCDPLNKSSAPNLYSFVQNKSTRLVDPNGLEDLEQSFADIDLTEHNDPSKSEIYNKLKDKREHAKPLAKPMTQEQARKESAKAQKKFRKEQGMKGSEVQAGHTSAVRDAAESGIRSEDLDKDMQQLHSRKGKGLDVDVTDQQGNVRTTTRHRTQEGIIDEATEKVRKATPDGKLTPQGQLDAAAEVRWRTENIPLDQRDVERVRKGGQAAVEAAEDANKGRALLDEAMKKSKGLTDVADEVVKESGKGAKVMAKLGKAGRRFAAAIPIAGAVLGHASAAHAAASGDVTGAALDEAGNIPIAGDLLDAARGGYALGEAINEGLVPESTQMAIGGAIFNAAEKLGFNPIDW